MLHLSSTWVNYPLILFFCTISQYGASLPLDTIPFNARIPQMNTGKKWIEMGIGSTIGSLKEVDYSEDLKIRFQSVNFNISYNQDMKNGKFGLGMRGSFGSVGSSDIRLYTGYNYATFGHYLVIDKKGIGFRIGYLFIDQDRDSSNPNFINLAPHFYLRLGKTSSYYFDVSLTESPAIGSYPEPLFSLGVFNYGFGEEKGTKNIRIAWSVIFVESALSLSFRHPIGQPPIIFEGALHIQKNAILSLSARYSFDMSWK